MKRKICPNCNANKRALALVGKDKDTALFEFSNGLDIFKIDICTICGAIYCYEVDRQKVEPYFKMMNSKVQKTLFGVKIDDKK